MNNETPLGWNPISQQPPDELVSVIDKSGNLGTAFPCIYPFKVGKGTGGKWSSPIIPCDPYWDGDWMVSNDVGSLSTKVDGIIGWKKLN